MFDQEKFESVCNKIKTKKTKQKHVSVKLASANLRLACVKKETRGHSDNKTDVNRRTMGSFESQNNFASQKKNIFIFDRPLGNFEAGP